MKTPLIWTKTEGLYGFDVFTAAYQGTPVATVRAMWCGNGQGKATWGAFFLVSGRHSTDTVQGACARVIAHVNQRARKIIATGAP